MPKRKYVDKRFSADSLATIERANQIIDDYRAQGFDLTLRQLYYQFVSRAWIANKDSEYKRLGSIVGDGRLAGLIDWTAITDRTRNLRSNSHWDSPAEIISACANSFAYDKWAAQDCRPEVWIEKDALVGILEAACEPLDVAYFSCRGYTSLSEVWTAAQRLIRYERLGQTPIVIHLGDHDPSGIDMSRDIQDRLATFGASIEFKRVALNLDQVRRYNPPPNPAKQTDARFKSYNDIYGDESWELDALDPVTLTQIIQAEIAAVRDQETWDEKVEEENAAKTQLSEVSRRWDDVISMID